MDDTEITVPYTGFQKTCDIISVMVILYGGYILFTSWNIIPDTIPLHFNFKGEPDSYGSKSSLFFLPLLSVFLFGCLTIANIFLTKSNIPWKITPENALRQYALIRTMLVIMKLEMIACFTYIEWKTIDIALGKSNGLNSYFLLFFVLLIFGTIGGYFYASYKAR